MSALKTVKLWLPWLLIYMRINEMFNATEWDIFFCFSYNNNMILSSILLIVNVSQMDWRCCQILGMSKQALNFVRDGKTLCFQMKIQRKLSFFLTRPLLKMVWSKTFCTLEIFEEPHFE